MKKTIFLMAVAAFAMTSCTNEETLESNPGHAIDFRTAMGTRANAEYTYDDATDLQEFYVTAFVGTTEYFADAKFTRQEDGSYTSTPAYFWPSDNAELTFYAYAPSRTALGIKEGGATLTITSDHLEITGFAPEKEIGQQVDFIGATATGSKTASDNNEANGVTLEFGHELAQIEVQAKEKNDLYEFKIAGVRIGHVGGKASASSANEEDGWVLDPNGITNYEVLFEDAPTTLASDGTGANLMKTGNALLIPQTLTPWDTATNQENTTGSYLAVKLQVKDTKQNKIVVPENGGENDYTWAAVPMPAGMWDANNKYVYTLDFTDGAGYGAPEGDDNGDGTYTDPTKPGDPLLGKPIKFVDVTVSDWAPIDRPVSME